MPTLAQDFDPRIQAIFIYNFTRYIQWPQDSSKPQDTFVIGVIGESPIVKEMDQFALLKKVGMQSIEVLPLESESDKLKCHILFVAAAESHQIPQLACDLDGQGVLIIAEKEGMSRQGAVINFIGTVENTRYEVNKKALRAAGLTCASQLEKLGEVLEE